MDPILTRSLLMFTFGLGLILLGVLLSPLTLLDRVPDSRRGR